MQLGYQELDLRAIAPSPTNPRKSFPENELAELASSITEQGVIQPIVVRPYPFDEYPDPDGLLGAAHFEIIAGERRWRAATMAGLDKIPAIVKDVPTRQVLEIQIIENLQRRDVNELEEADGYRLMMESHGYAADELAAKIGKSKAYIYARLKLCDLKPAGRQAFLDSQISASVALLIARIPTQELQARALNDVTGTDMSARSAAGHIQQTYMLDLARAPFPLDDASLYGGACKACPYNTSNDRILFADTRANVCTSPDCHAIKKLRFFADQATALREAGHTVIQGDEARRAAPYGAQWVNGYEQLDSLTYDPIAQESRPVRDVFADYLAGVPRVFIENVQSGGFIECITVEAANALRARRAEAQQAIRDSNGHDETPDAPQARANTEFERRKARIQSELDRRAKLFTAVREAYTTGINGAAALHAYQIELRCVARFLIENSSAAQTLCRWFPDADTGNGFDDDIARQQLEALDAAKLLTLLLDVVIEHEVDVMPWQIEEDEIPRNLYEMADCYGVPTDAPAESSETPSTPTQAAPARDSERVETPQPEPAPTAEQAAPAPDPEPAKAKAKPKAKAAAKTPKSSSPASGAGGEGKTPAPPKRAGKKAAEVVA